MKDLTSYDIPSIVKVDVTLGATYDRISLEKTEDGNWVQHKHGPFTVMNVALNVETKQELIVLSSPTGNWVAMTPAWMSSRFEKRSNI